MLFLNWMLVGGALAGGIPLAIHLLRRSNPKVVRWGAMQFLAARTIQQRRRFRLERLFLLLLRIAIPVVLALCMARPVVSWLRGLADNGPRSLVVLLDDSASMASGGGGQSGYEKAVGVLQKELAELPRGSEVAVLSLCFPEHPLVDRTVNLPRAAGILGKSGVQPAPAQPGEAIEAAARQFAQMHHARRQVLVLTDFQKSNWSEELAPGRSRALERLRGLSPAPRIHFYDTGGAGAENVAVEQLEFSKLPVGVNQRLRFRATLRNFGSKPRVDLNVRWKVDGVLQTTSQTTLGARESAQVVFEHSFAETGGHSVEVGIDPDAVRADDALFAAVDVRPALSVLLVNGSPSPEPLKGESDFLELALQALSGAHGQGAGLLRANTTTVQGLDAKALAGRDVVVLANVQQLTEPQIHALEAFVEKGGGLLFFPGNRTDSRWANQHLFRDGRGLLPAEMHALQNRSAEVPGSPLGGGLALAADPVPHPVLEPFKHGGGALGEIRVHTWYSLRSTADRDVKPQPNKVARAPATAVLALENGEPLFLESKFGNGVVMQSAVSCGSNWGNLPTRPAFVPLMQRLAVYAGSAMLPPRNVTTGEPLTALYPAEFGGRQLSVRTADGSDRLVSVRAGKPLATAEFGDTRLPGLYEFKTPDGGTQLFAVNLTREESNPEKLSDAELAALAKGAGAALAQSPTELKAAEEERTEGREMWRPLLWLVLLFLFLEPAVQQRFSRKEGGAA
jgi:hypothetical protein